jgi:hypothetical protein
MNVLEIKNPPVARAGAQDLKIPADFILTLQEAVKLELNED